MIAKHNLLLPLLIASLAASLTALGASADAPIVQPGAPGQPTLPLDADKAIEIANTKYSPVDVRFMQDMIPHHHQAQHHQHRGDQAHANANGDQR